MIWRRSEYMSFNHFDWTPLQATLATQHDVSVGMEEVQNLLSKIYSQAKTLIIKCWHADPLRRPTFDVIKHEKLCMSICMHWAKYPHIEAFGNQNLARILEFQATWVCLLYSPHIHLLWWTL